MGPELSNQEKFELAQKNFQAEISGVNRTSGPTKSKNVFSALDDSSDEDD